MKLAIRYYQKLDNLQKRTSFKIAAMIIVALLALVLNLLLLRWQPEWVPQFLTTGALNTILYTSLVIAWWALVIWLNLALTYLLISVGTTLLAGMIYQFGMPNMALAVAGMGTLAFTFLLLIQAVLFIFSYPTQILAVAHTVVKESVRLKVSVFFIVVLLIMLPLIPSMTGHEIALRYRIQSFISWSTGLTFYLTACMTIFLACATVAFEIRDRQIWQLMTKPLSRINYLIGKWVGIVSVNLVILIVAGLSIFIFVQYLRNQPADNEADAWAVENEVLVARVGRNPTYDRIGRDELADLVDDSIEKDFTLKNAIDSGIKNKLVERQRIAKEIQESFQRNQRTVAPEGWKDFVFKGLNVPLDKVQTVRLRYRVHYGGEDTHETHPISFIVRKNNKIYSAPNYLNPIRYYQYVPTQSHFFDIPADAISDEEELAGTLTISIFNGQLLTDGTIILDENTDRPFNFDYEDLEILYTAGGFEANYFRAMLVSWVKLSFLAMLGIAAATILNFPVACTVTFTIFLACVVGPFLSTSVEQFYVDDWWRFDRWIIKGIATAMAFLFKPFGEFNPNQLLVEGRLIAWLSVLWAFALLGVLWTGISLGVGFLAFRNRELAVYSGQG